MLSAVMQNASTIRASIEACLRTNLNALLEAGETSTRWSLCGRKRAVMIDSDMIGARKETAFSPKHHFSPRFARACPASAGPTMTATLN